MDGDIETLQLKDEKWKLVTDDSESDQVRTDACDGVYYSLLPLLGL